MLAGRLVEELGTSSDVRAQRVVREAFSPRGVIPQEANGLLSVAYDSFHRHQHLMPTGQRQATVLDQPAVMDREPFKESQQTSLQCTLNKILGAIQDSKMTFQPKIGQMSIELSLLRGDHQKLSDRVENTNKPLPT
ncbi:hypothetical protein NDU88_002854 [Pleurodeles waltl]|uniref:Uncharacterized protein n=1 Tax=Pleurodeles waltl TaxID=8319 RepID=A0AAV7Q7A2_PLEWA|nr:hypothetical protein NDU88_002854 [Pleurodeles waltl]